MQIHSLVLPSVLHSFWVKRGRSTAFFSCAEKLLGKIFCFYYFILADYIYTWVINYILFHATSTTFACAVLSYMLEYNSGSNHRLAYTKQLTLRLWSWYRSSISTHFNHSQFQFYHSLWIFWMHFFIFLSTGKTVVWNHRHMKGYLLVHNNSKIGFIWDTKLFNHNRNFIIAILDIMISILWMKWMNEI
jgi:hypothetical protein